MKVPWHKASERAGEGTPGASARRGRERKRSPQEAAGAAAAAAGARESPASCPAWPHCYHRGCGSSGPATSRQGNIATSAASFQGRGGASERARRGGERAGATPSPAQPPPPPPPAPANQEMNWHRKSQLPGRGRGHCPPLPHFNLCLPAAPGRGLPLVGAMPREVPGGGVGRKEHVARPPQAKDGFFFTFFLFKLQQTLRARCFLGIVVPPRSLRTLPQARPIKGLQCPRRFGRPGRGEGGGSL